MPAHRAQPAATRSPHSRAFTSGYCWFPSVSSYAAHHPCAPFMPFFSALASLGGI